MDIRTIKKCALRDSILRARLALIISRLEITTVVETGVDYGGSTYQFSQIAPRVLSIDNDAAKMEIVTRALAEAGVTNVSILCTNSPDGLRQLLGDGLDASRTLFMLDAHWQSYWPLLDEIRTIPRGQGVIVTHDTVVPGHPELWFDTYDGQALSYEYVRDELTAWSPDHAVEYNDAAEHPRCGVMFVYPTAAAKALSGAIR